MNAARYHLELGCQKYEEQKFKTAIRHFGIASQLGNAEAQVNLGNMYDAGIGTAPNMKLAVRCYKLAIRKGVSEAAYNLAVTYREHGQRRWADYWLRRASGMGDADAAEAVTQG